MNYNGLGEAVERFSAAIKHALGVLPKETVVEYFASRPDVDLQEILTISEQMEEYELCALIAQAQQKRNRFTPVESAEIACSY